MDSGHLIVCAVLATLGACRSAPSGDRAARTGPDSTPDSQEPAAAAKATARLPLVRVRDVDLPGGATRFDYQAIDARRGRLVIAHMNDDAVLFVDLRDGSVSKELRGIPVARGVAVAQDAGIVFVTSSPHQLVLIDAVTMEERTRVDTGQGPDGVDFDPVDAIVGVSDQRDGALSLIAGAGEGTRRAVHLGEETGNVVFDAARGWFWISVVPEDGVDQLVAVNPVSAAIEARIELPGCEGAHGVRLHPDGKSAFVACESNDVLARVELTGAHTVTTADTGKGPDVLAIDPGIGLLYVAAESGELTVVDIARPGVVVLGHAHPGGGAHTVSVDPASHRVFFPLPAGEKGTPVLRIMRPSGS